MAFQELPLDILHNIIRLIPCVDQGVDTYTLRNCAIASSRLLQPSQQALFEVVTLSARDWWLCNVKPSRLSKILLRTLKNSPRPLNQYIRSLVLEDGEDGRKWLTTDKNIPLILSQCPNLVYFSLGGPLFEFKGTSWYRFSEEFTTSLECVTFPNITSLTIHWNLIFDTSGQFFSLFLTLTSLRSLDLQGLEISTREPVSSIVENFPNSGKRQPISVLRISRLCEGLADDIIQCFLHPSAPVSIDRLSSLMIEDEWLDAAAVARLLEGQLEPSDLKNITLSAIEDGDRDIEDSFFDCWSKVDPSALERLTQVETLEITVPYTTSCIWLNEALSASSESRMTKVVIVLGISFRFGGQILDLKHFEELKAILADGDKFPRHPSLTVHVQDSTNDQFFENVMEDLRKGTFTIPAFEILPDGSDEPWMEPDDHDDGRYWESWDNEPGSPRLRAAQMGSWR